jgi:ligand-binding sensor domain-containing protein/signal transduction histidine kinase
MTAAVLLPAAMAHALEPSTPLANFSRQAWGMENGLPQNTVQALAQTADGYLWLGTEVGLVRFDGNGFTLFDRNSRPALLGNDVRYLLATQDGALWIGTGDGLARLKDGAVRVFTAKDGLPGNEVRRLGRDPDGSYWVSTESGTAVISGDRLVGVGGDEFKNRNSAIVDAVRLKGGLWAQATATAVTVGRGDKPELRFEVGHELPGTRVQRLLADREDTLWIGTNAGLARWVRSESLGKSGGRLQLLPVTDPLAHASVLALTEDAEGNIWVGTEADGLHILRDQRFKSYGAREGLSSDATSTVVEGDAGKLWIGTNGGGLDVLRLGADTQGLAKTYTMPDVLLSSVILSLAAAPNGDLWVGTPDGLNRIRGSAVDSYTDADGLPDDFIRSLLADADGSLWIGTRRGLAHWTVRAGAGDALHPAVRTMVYTQANGLGSDLVGAMARDSNGDLWVATFAGLSRIANGKITNYTTADGLSSNVITALLARPGGAMLIGTQEHGWNLWDGHRFSRATNDSMAKATILAILDDGLNHLWFATGNGIARCDLSEGPSATTGADCSHWLEFGPADGLRSREAATNSHPSAWRSHDGMLWFATPKGLVEIDPSHFPMNGVPPPVAVERFAVDDSDEALRAVGPRISISAGHSHFQFDYAGLSFTAPQKVRYRYMLEGFDHRWTEAGARRTAYYTNIPPGHYTFRVQAANNDGVWNTQGATLVFELRPHFYQTLWFFAMLVAAMAALVVLLLRMRLVRAEREFRAVLGERNRIAREIHDTLAQGYVGISVQLELLSELLKQNKPAAAVKHLDKTREFVRAGLADARQSIWSLRSQDAGEITLPVQIRRMVEQADGHGIEASFSIYGAYRAMPLVTEREILRVAQEAIHNVKKHAGAQNLTVQLEYSSAEVALEVRDNGRGFAVDPVSSNGKPPESGGHYGLTGMRERAAVIGGDLEIVSVPDVGTTVRLRTPTPKGVKE